ncbi:MULTISPECIES: GLPGLI family protein [unclassified Polaribacter]|uniref:GLPGLI family protein n=1 Tax=unclassified Polaribacter TaxID=196858 RepID=UPI0011BE6432|nr:MULTISPECIES: GLPGLI family protein [unclassified Polaribacter]TXD54213.1 GLPGLI family protein [Polaribacter sp. IC063]TXD62478.1 GLPGLI family protein [Polaribacter sp. IC066]
MNIKPLSLLFFLISIISYSQTNKQFIKVKVSYSVMIHLDKNEKIYKIMEKYSPGLVSRIETVDSEIDFSLVFNDSISIFYLEKKLFSDNRAVRSVIINSGYYGRIKQQTKNYITEELEEDFGKFLVARSYQEWQLHDETKMIGEYLCFKATTFQTTTSPKGKVFTLNFTAWYTPQLPYKFGPAGFGNLPGLIIELQGEKATYGVKKIVFYDDEQIKENKMPELKRKKLMTEVEFEKLAAEDEKRWLNKNE